MSNLNLNKVILAGRLIADPELKSTQSGISVLSFTLAINRKQIGEKAQETDFIKIIAWRKTAEFIANYFKKGYAICVVGSIQTRKWTLKDGKDQFTTEVVVDEAMFVDSRNDSSSAKQDAPYGQSNTYTPDAYNMPSYSSGENTAPNFEEVKTDDDLPF